MSTALSGVPYWGEGQFLMRKLRGRPRSYLSIVVDDVELGVVLPAVHGVLAAVALAPAPVGVHLPRLVT